MAHLDGLEAGGEGNPELNWCLERRRKADRRDVLQVVFSAIERPPAVAAARAVSAQASGAVPGGECFQQLSALGAWPPAPAELQQELPVNLHRGGELRRGGHHSRLPCARGQ